MWVKKVVFDPKYSHVRKRGDALSEGVFTGSCVKYKRRALEDYFQVKYK